MLATRCLTGILLALLFAFPAQAESLLDRPPERPYDIVIESGFLKVGTYENFPPYSYLKDGKPTGVDIDIGHRIAEELGVEFRAHWIVPDENLSDDLRNNVWKGHYLAKRRIADIMMRVPYDKKYAYMQDSTGEYMNEQVVLFGPYHQEQWQIAYNPDKIQEVTTIALFQYHPIGVEIDTLPDFYLSSTFQGRLRNNVKHYTNIRAAFDAMDAGEVSAVMGMRAEVDLELHKRPDSGFVAATNGFPAIGKQVWDVGMAVKHTHRQLGYAIEAIVDGMVRDGEIEAIFARHGLRYSMPAFYDEILGVSAE
ncbi:transporter substrate-binding domain-containing protein [Marinobacter changyiensis]|uniref:substrate-binding periplasmic protein n=1 Tax=Marinobacter changyiensis TaxID=2604091 RepID=UPI0012650AD6